MNQILQQPTFRDNMASKELTDKTNEASKNHDAKQNKDNSASPDEEKGQRIRGGIDR